MKTIYCSTMFASIIKEENLMIHEAYPRMHNFENKNIAE